MLSWPCTGQLLVGFKAPIAGGREQRSPQRGEDFPRQPSVRICPSYSLWAGLDEVQSIGRSIELHRGDDGHKQLRLACCKSHCRDISLQGRYDFLHLRCNSVACLSSWVFAACAYSLWHSCAGAGRC